MKLDKTLLSKMTEAADVAVGEVLGAVCVFAVPILMLFIGAAFQP